MRRIVQVLAALGGISVVLGLVGLFVAWRMVASGFSSRPVPSAFEERVALRLREMAVPGRYEKMKNPVAVDNEVLARAKAHWADHCATCHANDGSGDTEIGRNLYPRPPDMRKARTQSMSDGQIYYMINQGIRLTGMPAWGEPGDDDRESWDLVAFIRALPSLTPAEVEAMKALNPVPASTVRARQHQQEEDDFLNGTDASAGEHGRHGM